MCELNREGLLSELMRMQREKGLAYTLHAVYGTDVRVSVAFSKAACASDIDVLELSVRSYNALRRAGLNTLEQLIGTVAQEGLGKIRNLGRKSMIEIKTRLLVYGFEELTEKERAQFFAGVMERNPEKTALLLKEEWKHG